MNKETTATINDSGLERGPYQIYAQNLVCSSLAASAKALKIAIQTKELDKEIKDKLITYIGNSARMTADAHHTVSLNRRAFIIPGLQNFIRSIAEKSQIDTFLFGCNFAEDVANAQKIEKCWKQLKAVPPNNKNSSVYKKKNFTAKNQQSSSNNRYENNYSNYKRPASYLKRNQRRGSVGRSSSSHRKTHQRSRR
ncbi:hypothetical protein QAD02_006162 [Eretmocerus hayati]|uniref:Uncharacterized protein n=1 Tax=Eretmocerus hayati TaxID=131215 RepID=A0ACC2N4A0_9HYME|nr:hypothetical protein QAD02_006162 [Eretmocerus hayati]